MKVSKRSAAAIAIAAASIGIEQDVMSAIVSVEASGVGYDKAGRPKVLFEKHKFWKHLGAGEQRNIAVANGLARQKWVSPANGGYADQSTDDKKWQLIQRAAALNEGAALMSVSWGAGQIMGEYWDELRYISLAEFVVAMASSEDAQIDAMARYIRWAGLVDECVRKDWRGIAAGYNGTGQIDVYAPRLQAAYVKYAAQPDILLSDLDVLPIATNSPPRNIGPLRIGDEGASVRELQRALATHHVSPAPTVDGDFGPKTYIAVRTFQKMAGLVVDGVAGVKTQRALGMF